MITIDSHIRNLVANALLEDLGAFGDLTSQFVIYPGDECQAKLIAKQAGVLAGLSIFEYVFKQCNPSISIEFKVEDGQHLENRDIVCQIKGNTRTVLTAERTALNFLQRLSGIATLTSNFVKQVEGTKVKILDTRKTTPGYRALEKYAVRMGGGHNHRMGLFDMILIKDNHIAAAGGISNAITRALESKKADHPNIAIEVEVTNLDQLKEAVSLPIQRVLLDNMSVDEIRRCVQFADGRIETELSGGVTIDTVRELAETGVDYISAGALTHSAKAMDLSLLID